MMNDPSITDFDCQRIVRHILNELCNGKEDRDCVRYSTEDSRLSIILTFVKDVQYYVRDLPEYKQLVKAFDPTEDWLNPAVLDCVIKHLFKHARSVEERLTRTCIFLTFVADIAAEIDDETRKDTLLKVSTTLIAKQHNPDDWQRFVDDALYYRLKTLVSGVFITSIAGLVVWGTLKWIGCI